MLDRLYIIAYFTAYHISVRNMNHPF